MTFFKRLSLWLLCGMGRSMGADSREDKSKDEGSGNAEYKK